MRNTTTSGTKTQPSTAPALDRGLAALEMVAAREPTGIGFTELVTILHLPVASATRLLQVLMQRQYIVKDAADGRYRLGKGLMALVTSISLDDRLRQEGQSLLDALRDATANTALLIRWTGEEMRCLAKAQHEDSMAMQEVGATYTNLLDVPWGWLFAASLSNDRLEALVQQTPEGAEKLRCMQNSLAQFHRDGFMHMHNTPNLRLAAPVFDQTSQIIAGIGLGAYENQVDTVRMQRLGTLVAQTAAQLSTFLGATKRTHR